MLLTLIAPSIKTYVTWKHLSCNILFVKNFFSYINRLDKKLFIILVKTRLIMLFLSAIVKYTS